MKPTEQYFHLLLLQEVLTFESVDEILKCDHSNKSYCDTVDHAVKGGSNCG